MIAGLQTDAHGVHAEIFLYLGICCAPQAQDIRAAVGSASQAEWRDFGPVAMHGQGQRSENLETPVNTYAAAEFSVAAGIDDTNAIGVEKRI